MQVLTPTDPNSKTDESLYRYSPFDGYEQGGLLYFRFEGKQMVAIVRERAAFEKHLEAGTSLQDYIDTSVGSSAYAAALEIEKLIPTREPPHSKISNSDNSQT